MEKRVQFMTFIFVGVIIAVVGCIVGMCYYANYEQQTLLVYSGASLKSVMDELGEEFEIETGGDVDIIYGGSGHIFGQLSITKRGDIFIPGAEYYTRQGIEEGLLNELLTYVAIGTVDAAIVWEDNVGTLVGQGRVNVVEIVPSKNIIKTIPVSVTKCTKNMELAEDFADFCCSKEGLEIWDKNGFEPYAG